MCIFVPKDAAAASINGSHTDSAEFGSWSTPTSGWEIAGSHHHGARKFAREFHLRGVTHPASRSDCVLFAIS